MMINPNTSLSLSLIRHGETELLTKGMILRGRIDDALTDKGWAQMHATFDSVYPTAGWQMIISSPLSRCRLFAKVQADKTGLPLYVLDDLQEISFGDWEGRLTADLFKEVPELMAKWWQTPTEFTPPDAESIADFGARIDRTMAQIATLATQHGCQHLCIITHGGVIKYLYCRAKNLPLDEVMQVPVELGELHPFSLVYHDNHWALSCG